MTREQAIHSMITHGFEVEQVGEIIKAVTPQEQQTFKWCETCKEYDQEKHCCHRWSKVIRNTVEEMKQEPKSEWEHDHEILKAYADGANKVLDKIRAEIKQYQSDYDVHGTEYDRTAWTAFNRCLQIIDKYKVESEVDNGNDD